MENAKLNSWFKGLKGRLLLISFLPVIGFGISFSIAYKGFKTQSYYLDQADKTIIPNLIFISEMRQARNKFAYNSRELMDLALSEQERLDHSAENLKALKEFSNGYKQYLSAPFLPGEHEIHDKVKNLTPEFIKIMEKVAFLLSANDPEKIKMATAILRGPFENMNKTIRDFNREIKSLYENTSAMQNKKADAESESALNWMIYVTVLSSIAVLVSLLWMAAKISDSIGTVSTHLGNASFQVATSVEQLNHSGVSLSNSATESAASLQETVASIEELSAMVQLNSENAKQAAALSVQSTEAAENGETEIKSLIQSMNEISRSSKRIEEIISVIDDIAFQINLLALNAAVEAARAGEQGKGFAVVAEAVRSLAQRSASSAKDINTLIKDSVHKIHHGGEIADRSGSALGKIVHSIKKVSELNNEIATANMEQASGIQQINKAMNQLDQASQENAALAEQISTSSDEISQMTLTTQSLTDELNTFVLGITSQDSAISHSNDRNNVVPLNKLKKPIAS